MLTAGSQVLTESCEREEGVKKSFVEVRCDCKVEALKGGALL